MAGELQPIQAPPSSLHAKAEGDSLEVNAKLAEVDEVVPEGPDVIVVCGAVVSTVQPRSAGVGSAKPEMSRARTSNVWLPFESDV